jgi:hypothetical protein
MNRVHERAKNNLHTYIKKYEWNEGTNENHMFDISSRNNYLSY